VLTARLYRSNLVMPLWGGLIFALQALGVAVFTWLAVRQATRPLTRLVEAAETLGTSMQCEPIAEDGPLEVARAAAAFNTMGRRIKDHLAERVRILAAISHDLQTPITRMRLRADLLDDPLLRHKLSSDLDAMQVLVEEGIAYARSADRPREPQASVDVGAMLDALVCDYADAGHNLTLCGLPALVVQTRPHTLRRVVINLVDNALKFGEQVEIEVARSGAGRVAISVLDRGPGIAQDQLAAVMQPFYRLESSRNRKTGGTGLGLAIAQQLVQALGGSLSLANRTGGGLAARVEFDA
jgi:signal transduction histidine kinase